MSVERAEKVTVLVAAVEGAIVVTCALPKLALAGSITAVLLLSLFTVVLARAITRGTTAPCRCFGSSDRPVGWLQVGRNVVLVVVAAGAAVGATARHGSPTTFSGETLALFVGLVITVLLVRLDDLADLLVPIGTPSRPGPPAR